MFAGSHQVAHQRGGGRREGNDGHEGKRGYVADDVGGCQLAFAQMLDTQKEEEPGAEREHVLQHDGAAQTEQAAHLCKADTWQLVEGVLVEVDVPACVDHEKCQRNGLGQRAAYSGSGDAELRHTEMAEYQGVVEQHVAEH